MAIPEGATRETASGAVRLSWSPQFLFRQRRQRKRTGCPPRQLDHNNLHPLLRRVRSRSRFPTRPRQGRASVKISSVAGEPGMIPRASSSRRLKLDHRSRRALNTLQAALRDSSSRGRKLSTRGTSCWPHENPVVTPSQIESRESLVAQEFAMLFGGEMRSSRPELRISPPTQDLGRFLPGAVMREIRSAARASEIVNPSVRSQRVD